MRLILHAGTHKTGTTSIQHFAHDNHAALLKRGLYYLVGETTLGGKTKVWRSNNWLAHGLTGAYREGEASIEAALNSARDHASDGATVMISSEDLSSCCQGHPLWGGLGREDYRDMQNAYLRRLSELLGDYEVEVVLVFRRADEYAESLYQTMIKSNRFSGSFEDFVVYCAPLFDYGAQLHAFRRVFSTVRVLSYHTLGANLVEGFMQEIGFPVTDTSDYRRNTSVDARLIHWKAMCDMACDNDPKQRSLRRAFILSDHAKAIYAGSSAASFWRSIEERAAFHDCAVANFPELSFPDPKARLTKDARLADADFNAITAEFETWHASKSMGWRSRMITWFGLR